MRPIARIRPATAGAALLTLLAGPLATASSALDVLVNGKLDASVAGWSQNNGAVGTFGFDPDGDASGSAFSGSLEMIHQTPDGGTSMWVGQCIAVQPGSVWLMGGKLRFRDDEEAFGRAKLLAHFYAEPGCKGAYLGGAGSAEVRPQIDGRGVWFPLFIGSQASGAPAPAGAQSVRFSVFVANVQLGLFLTVHADDLFVATVGTPMCAKLPATILGTPGPDTLLGTAGSDVIVGLGGADQIDGKGGNDRICGGPGGDTLYGGTGDDQLFGNGGADHLYGGQDDDRLVGAGGGDSLYGGPGKDRMNGGAGNDDCDGGPDGDPPAPLCETVNAVP
jgi:hypothetical protein